jgi:ABC-2 type transport system permease protein
LIKIPVGILAISFIIATLAGIPIMEIGFMIDLFRPLLVWDNPQKAVKQNLNCIISMFFNILWVGVIIYVVGNFITNFMLAYITLAIIFIVLGILLYSLLMKYAEKRYYEIEP